jgi:hypothetical protein
MPAVQKRQAGAANPATASRTRRIQPGALKLREAAEYLGGISIPTMHRLVDRGLLKPNRALRHLLFPVTELQRFLESGVRE